MRNGVFGIWRRARSLVAASSHKKLLEDRSRLGLDQAEDARRQADWPAAIEFYNRYLAVRPKDLGIHLRLIKAYRAVGRLDQAEDALRRLIVQRPDRADLQMMLNDLLRAAGRSDEAALEGRSTAQGPRRAGAPETADAIWRAQVREALGSAQTRARLDEAVDSLKAWRDAGNLSIADYNAFQKSSRPPRPPQGERSPLTVLIDARHGSPVELRATLLSLQDQSHTGWVATVMAGEAVLNHSVASLQYVEPRIAFAAADEDPGDGVMGPVLRMSAGCVLHPDAIEWMTGVLARSDAVAVYCDHDRGWDHWRHGAFRFDPALQCRPHLEDIRTNPRPPIATLFRSREVYAAADDRLDAGDGRRPRLMAAFASGPVAHIPLVLATAMERVLTDAERHTPDRYGPDRVDAVPASPEIDLATGRILVIIPTRDEAASLKVMVESLIAKAAASDAIDILIVDNGSRESATRRLLQSWSGSGRVTVLDADEPFNWSRLNNLAADGKTQDIFLFANNDMEMLSANWDAKLREALGVRQTGVVGVRLAYPGGHIQHGGMALGALNGTPVHEAIGATADDGGPLDRWIRSRPAAAVTGAFMAVRRDTFHAVGGFDAVSLAVACNDIDFCLKVRELGLTILYRPDILLSHAESKTRGHADSSAKVMWAEAELASVYRRWGDALIQDPGRNPQWLGDGVRLFHGFRALTLTEVLSYVACPGPEAWRAHRHD